MEKGLNHIEIIITGGCKSCTRKTNSKKIPYTNKYKIPQISGMVRNKQN